MLRWHVFSFSHALAVTTPRFLSHSVLLVVTVCWHSRHPDLALFCARSDPCQILLLLREFSEVCWRGQVVPNVPWRYRWLWDIRVWICSMRLSVNFSCFTILHTTELTSSSLVLFLIDYPLGTSVFRRVILFAFDQVRPFCCAARGQWLVC